jgi:hypothetical protein
MSWDDHMMGYNQLLLGGFTHFFMFHNIWDNPIDSYFSRWLKHVKIPPARANMIVYQLDVSE